MRSVKSCFNPTLFRKNVTRFWPIWGVYLVLWLLVLPLQILHSPAYLSDLVLSSLSFGVGMAVFFGLLSAMAVFSYLYNNRSVQLMHALPITREGLFLTNYLSGLAFLLLPNVLVFLLSLLAGGYPYPGVLVLWLAAQSLIALFFYSFAVFCAMFTGNLLALPIFYGILNWLVMGVIFVVNALLRELLFGFWGTTWMDSVAEWFTPVSRLVRAVRYDVTSSGVYYLTGMPAVLLYALVGVLLAVAALLIYRKRRLETAGDVVSVRQMRPVFKYGVAFCAAVVVGTWFYQTFRSLFPRGNWVILLPLLVWGAAGYFVADMLLKKTFRVFARSWKGLVAFSLVLVAAFAVTDMDLFGFNRVPKRSDVVSVSLSGVNTMPYDAANSVFFTLTDPADIDTVLQLQGIISANKNTLRAETADIDRYDYNTFWREGTLSDGTVADLEHTVTTDLMLRYTLADGREIRRQYHLPLYADDLTDPGSVTALLDDILNRPASLAQGYWRGLIEGAALAYTSLNIYDPAQQDYITVSIPNQADRDRLLAAVQADMTAGRIGRRYLFQNAERYENCYYNDLAFTFFVPKSSLGSNATEDWTTTIPVTLQTTATETLKVLRELGYSGDQLVTWAEYRQQGGGEKYSNPKAVSSIG
jgi:ABC-2 type transport system permease protein